MCGLSGNIIFYILIIQEGFSGGRTHCLKNNISIINKTSGTITVTDHNDGGVPCRWTFLPPVLNYEVVISVQTKSEDFPNIKLYDPDIRERSCTIKGTLCASYYEHEGQGYNGSCYEPNWWSWRRCEDDKGASVRCLPCSGLDFFGVAVGHAEIDKELTYCYNNCANRTKLSENCTEFLLEKRADAILEYYEDSDGPFHITYRLKSCDGEIASTGSPTTRTTLTSSSSEGHGTYKAVTGTTGTPTTKFSETKEQKARRIVSIVVPVLAVVILILVTVLIIAIVKRRAQRGSNAADDGKVEVSNVLYESYPGGGERQEVDNVLYGTTS